METKLTDFEKAFARNTEGLMYESAGTCDGCDDCPEYDEGSFSWQPCDFCGSRLGGDRYSAHAVYESDKDQEIAHFEVCTDCIMYMANGEVPEEWS